MQVRIPDDLFDLLKEYDTHCRGHDSDKGYVEGLIAAVLVDFINGQVGNNRGGLKLREMYDKYISEHGK